MNLTLALIQYDFSGGSAEKNARLLAKHLDKAFTRGARLALVPEICMGGPRFKAAMLEFAAAYRQHLPRLAQTARLHRAFLYGSGIERDGAKYYNTAFWMNPEGKFRWVYRKNRLFRYEKEHHLYTAGSERPLINTPWGKIAPLICYDLRFPEIMRDMVLRGAKICLISAQWPCTRREHWLTLLRARAIENQIYVIACNRTGDKGALHYSGDSCVVSPWGDIEMVLPENKSVGIATIDLGKIADVRRHFPFLKDAPRRIRFDSPVVWPGQHSGLKPRT